MMEVRRARRAYQRTALDSWTQVVTNHHNHSIIGKQSNGSPEARQQGSENLLGDRRGPARQGKARGETSEVQQGRGEGGPT